MSDLDIKQMRAFSELYRSRSVSRTAERLGMSQPSISVILNKLRTIFKDQLFVRTSAGMQPTPAAEALVGHISRALNAVDTALGTPIEFDPITSERRFVLSMNDIGQAVVLPHLLNYLKASAPRIRIRVVNLSTETPHLLECGSADVAIGFTSGLQAGFMQQKFFDENFVCMVSKDHPRIGHQLLKKHYLDEQHATVELPGTDHSTLDKTLAKMGVVRQVAVHTPSFLGLAQVVAETELVGTLPAHLAQILAKQGGVRIFPLPVKVPSYPIKQYWHRRYTRDPGHRWLRNVGYQLFAE